MKTVLPWMVLAILPLDPDSALAQSIRTVQFGSASYSVRENAGCVEITVERIGPPGSTAHVEYGSQSGSATFGEDYVEQTGSLSFDGETNLTIVVPILNDAAPEREENFSVSLFNPDPVDSELIPAWNSAPPFTRWTKRRRGRRNGEARERFNE